MSIITKLILRNKIFYPLISISPILKHNLHSLNQTPYNFPKEDEILNELSDLLPIRHRFTPNPNLDKIELTAPSTNTSYFTELNAESYSVGNGRSAVKCAADTDIDDKCDSLVSTDLDSTSAVSADVDDKCDRLDSLDLDDIDAKRDVSDIDVDNNNVGFKALREPKLDMLLTPEDMLRGVFVQKLKGKTAVKRALTAASADIDVKCDFGDLVSKVLNRGCLDGESMVTVFEWAVESGKICESVDSYNVVFKALGRRKFFDVMEKLLGEMRGKGINGNYETLFVFVDSYVKAKRVSKALDLFKKLDEFGMQCDLDCLKVMLRCLCQRARVSSASSLMNKMKGKVRFDGETYNIVIRGWCKVGKINEIERLLNEMVEDGFDPDSLTLSYLLEGLGRGGRIDDAVKIFENLKEHKDYLLNAVIFNAMIFNFISIGDIDECLKYYNDMLSKNYEPNLDTYVPIIFVFLKARRVSDAIEMFDEMIGRGIMPTTGVVTSIIESLCSYGPPHAAMMIYKKAKDAKCTISVTTYKILLTRLSRFAKCGMLLNVWDEMEQSGFASDVEVYEYVINGLCNNGQLEKGVLVMEDCLKNGFCPSRLICAKLNNKLLASNKVEMAYKLFLKIKKSRRDENAQKYWRAKGWHF